MRPSRQATNPAPRARAADGDRAPRGRALGDRTICAGLFVLAALVRLAFLRGVIDRDLPFSVFYYGDSRLYREFALALLDGRTFDQGIPFHPPLLAWVLAGIIRLVGENAGLLRAAIALIGATAVPLTYLLGVRLWDRDRRVALKGALLATFSFGLIVLSVSPNTEAVYVPLLLGQALAFVALHDALAAEPLETRRVTGLAIVSGVLFGLGALTRAEHLGLAPALALALFIGSRRAGARRLATVGALGAAAALLVILPWSARNFVTIGAFNRDNPQLEEPLSRFVLVSNYGPLNFAVANGPGADGTFRPDLVVAVTGTDAIDLRHPRHHALYVHGYREGLSALAADPAAAARLLGRKLVLSSEALALGFGASNWPAGLTGTRRAVDLFVPASRALLPISLVLLCAGAFVSRALWRRGSVVWLIAASKVAVCLAFYGYARLFAALLPFVFLVQAAGLAAGLAALRARLEAWRARRVLAVAGIVLIALLGLELAYRVAVPRNLNATGSVNGATGRIIQDAEVTLAPAP